MITFAHRGASAHEPENTLAAFHTALRFGATGLESDVWLSGDGEPVLVHDEVIRRGVRRIRVTRTDARHLAEVGVPRLADLYEACGTAYELSLDLNDHRAAPAVVAVARKVGASGRLWLCSASTRRLLELREEAPDVHLVLSRRRRELPEPVERHAASLAGAGLDAMNMHHTDWSAGLVALFHRFGIRAFAWDVQQVRHLHAMLAIGVDALYCDDVPRMVATVREWQASRPGALQEPDGVQRPDSDEDAPDDRRLGDRPEHA